MRAFGLALLFLACGASAEAAPNCESADVQELCAIARDTLGDNPAFEKPDEWTTAAERARAQRHAKRRGRAADLLNGVANPTWRDLYNAGYTMFYGDTRQDNLLALAIAIRALSLAPNEPDVRHLVAMITDKMARNYVGAQLYGRQKFFKLNPRTSELELMCLPQMIDPPLPASVGEAFEPWPKGFDRCPKGVGESPTVGPTGK